MKNKAVVMDFLLVGVIATIGTVSAGILTVGPPDGAPPVDPPVGPPDGV